MAARLRFGQPTVHCRRLCVRRRLVRLRRLHLNHQRQHPSLRVRQQFAAGRVLETVAVGQRKADARPDRDGRPERIARHSVNAAQ